MSWIQLLQKMVGSFAPAANDNDPPFTTEECSAFIIGKGVCSGARRWNLLQIIYYAMWES